MSRLTLLTVAAIVAIADLATKSLAFSFLEEHGYGPGEIHWVFGRWFGLARVMNPGVTGGLGSGLSPMLLTGFTIAAVVGITLYVLLPRHPSAWTGLPLALILGGAIGNLYDRIRFEMVRDFLDVWPRVPSGGWFEHWPTFNVADSAIVTGVVTLVFHSLFLANREKDDAAEPAPAEEA